MAITYVSARHLPWSAWCAARLRHLQFVGPLPCRSSRRHIAISVRGQGQASEGFILLLDLSDSRARHGSQHSPRKIALLRRCGWWTMIEHDQAKQPCIYRAHTHHVGACLVAFTGPHSLSRRLDHGLAAYPSLFTLCGLPCWHFVSPSTRCEQAQHAGKVNKLKLWRNAGMAVPYSRDIILAHMGSWLCAIDNIQTTDCLQVSALAFGVLSLCSHLEVIESEVTLRLAAFVKKIC
jgi:hypothetical protein